jgi:hypothetical protein
VTIQEFVSSHDIRAVAIPANSNPNADADSWAADANHWRMRLRYGARRMDVPFSTGSALSEPDAADVLDCLASDAASIQYSRDFEDWATDLGFDPDSRKAHRSYQLTVRQSARLQHFLGEDLYAQLLEAER